MTDKVSPVRIALVSPYSWTYPGGVTRHIEALAAELSAAGHEPRVLSPFDPDDATSRRLHRGAGPGVNPLPEGFVSLGRTIGPGAFGRFNGRDRLGDRGRNFLIRNSSHDHIATGM